MKNGSTLKTLLLSGTLLGLSAAGLMPAAAQDVDDTAPVPAELDTPRSLDQVIVTARRASERAQDVPIAMTTITSADIQKLSARDIIEIQKITPGLYMNSQNSAGRVKVTIRGQSEADSRLTTDPSVGIYIDGVNYLRTYGMRSSFVDLAQVEVLKGPQGTLFGKNTTGGAINITTQRPEYESGGYVDLLYGSYNNAQVLGVINIPIIEDKLAIRAVGQLVNRDGYGEKFDGRDIGDDDVVTTRLHVRADPAENIRMLFSADYVRQRNTGTNVILTNDSMLSSANFAGGALGAVAAELGLDPASDADRMTAYNAWRTYYDAYQRGVFHDGFETDPRGIYDDVDHWGVSANISVDVGDITITSITSFRDLYREYIQGLDGTPFLLLPALLKTDQTNVSQEFQVTSIDGVGLDWQVGAFFNEEEGYEFSASETNTVVGTRGASVSDTDSVNKSAALYGQAVVHLSDKIRFTGGARYTDDYREIDSHNRRDPEFALGAASQNATGVCRQLNPAAGGSAYPNCTYKADTSFQEWTWLASLDWKPAPDHLLYVSASKGYRAGGYTAQGIAGPYPTLEALEAAATPYDPEEVLAYEVGFKSDFMDRTLRINGAAYLQDYTNIQQQVRDVVMSQPVTLIRNAAEATLWGGEIEVLAAPTDHATINFGAAYLNAEYDEYFERDSTGNLIDLSDQAFSAPEWTYNFGGSYVIPLANGDITLNANYSWVDDVVFRPETPDISSVSQEAYGLLDARLTWRIASQDIDISLFGKNLTDEEYIVAATNLQSLGYNVAFPGDPRVFGVQLRKNY